jgi:hypothetical protein
MRITPALLQSLDSYSVSSGVPRNQVIMVALALGLRFLEHIDFRSAAAALQVPLYQQKDLKLDVDKERQE